jgi:energy-coupling factor transporter ATP-binding protein EcfA2
MRQKLCKRLEELEKISAAAAQRVSNHVSADSVIEELRAVLCANNFPQEPNESLAETLARFMGISLRELKQQLADLSYGHSRSVHAGGLG